MATNQVTAEALKGILYETLLRLNHEDLDGNKEGLSLEMKRAKSIADVAGQILNVEKLKLQTSSVRLKAEKLRANMESSIDSKSVGSGFFDTDLTKRLS